MFCGPDIHLTETSQAQKIVLLTQCPRPGGREGISLDTPACLGLKEMWFYSLLWANAKPLSQSHSLGFFFFFPFFPS